MTVIGNDIVLNCKRCWCESGYSIRLEENGGSYRCPHCRTQYEVKGAYIQEIR